MKGPFLIACPSLLAVAFLAVSPAATTQSYPVGLLFASSLRAGDGVIGLQTADVGVVESGHGDRPWLSPDGEPLPFGSVEEILEFLATANPVENKPISTGITRPRKLLLEQDGIRVHAIFHNVKIYDQRERPRRRRVMRLFVDHYANNVAAFELSRMLGMTNVPPAVLRKVGRQRGSVQLWIEDSITEVDRRRQAIALAGDSRLSTRDMQVFDNLSNNIDRNQGNILYDSSWNLWLIDHTRTFGPTKKLPSPGKVNRCSRRLRRALQEADDAAIRRRLDPYLGSYEIDGLLARKELLIALIQERIDERGEAAVLFSYSSAAGEDGPAIPEAPPS